MASDGALHKVAFAICLGAGLLAAGCGRGAPEEQLAATATDDGASNLPAAVRPFPAGLSGTLAFESDREGRTKIYALDLATGRVRRLTQGPLWHDGHPVWSPDGRRIAFHSTREGNFKIWLMNADGSGLERVTDGPARDLDPSWASDGKSIFFTADRHGGEELYRVWLDTRKVDRLTAGVDRAIMPAVSPDGRFVAYAGQTSAGLQIQVIDLATGGRRQVTAGGAACRPGWSPDSKEIAYVLIDAEPSSLEVANVETREKRRIVADPKLWSYYPVWSPDRQYIAFSVSPQHHQGEDWDLALYNTKAGKFVRLTYGPGNDRLPHWKPAS